MLEMNSSSVKIIPKAWGHEEIIANAGFCFKRLVIKKGWRVSYHHHKIKDELFYCESGLVNLRLNGKVKELRPRQWARIRPGDWHSMGAIEDSVLLEASTHDDPQDSFRDPSCLSGRVPINGCCKS